MILIGKDFARVVDSVISFHIEFDNGKLVVSFFDAAVGGSFQVTKRVSKKFDTELLRDALMNALFLTKDGEDMVSIINIDEIIEKIDKIPAKIKNELADDYYLQSALSTVVTSNEPKLLKMNLEEIINLTKAYLDGKEVPEWFAKIFGEGKTTQK